MHIGIVGNGVVGRALARFFSRSASLRLSIYDKYLPGCDAPDRLLSVSRADIVFVAVPTPFHDGNGACDLSEVDDAIRNLTAPICIKSTVPPGTTDGLIARTGKHIAFSPEYVGESPGHPWTEIDACGFAVFGGDPLACDRARQAYDHVESTGVRYFETTALTAELGKYMENAFLASKVAFVNQFYDLAVVAGVEFEPLRDMFLLDSRVGETHTRISIARGFGGKCLPKDLKSIIAWADDNGVEAPLLRAILAYNDSLHAG